MNTLYAQNPGEFSKATHPTRNTSKWLWIDISFMQRIETQYYDSNKKSEGVILCVEPSCAIKAWDIGHSLIF